MMMMTTNLRSEEEERSFSEAAWSLLFLKIKEYYEREKLTPEEEDARAAQELLQLNQSHPKECNKRKADKVQLDDQEVNIDENKPMKKKKKADDQVYPVQEVKINENERMKKKRKADDQVQEVKIDAIEPKKKRKVDKVHCVQEVRVGEYQPKKKRITIEKDDSEETLKLLLDWNSNMPEKPPESITNAVGVCSKPVRKQLTKSDVNEGQMRLMLGKKQVEKMMLRVIGKSKGVIGENGLEVPVYGKSVIEENGLEVPVYGQKGEAVRGMMFKMWNTDTPVLTSSGWNEFVKHYKLKKHSDFVTIWMFKHKVTGELCFAIDHTRFDEIEKPLSNRILKDAFNDLM